jgi:hypothetical protein
VNNSENGNTTKYRLEQVENCCKENKELLDSMKFVKFYENDIRELNVMQNDLKTIKQAIIEKKESDKWVMRLLVGALVTGILTPVVIKLLGFD